MNYQEEYEYARRDYYYLNKNILEMENDHLIKKYLKLLEDRCKVEEKLNKLYPYAMKEKYDICNHLWVSDNMGARKCLRCELNTLDDNEITQEYIKNNRYSIYNNEFCIDINDENEFYLCKDIFYQLIKINPLIDNTIIIEYINDSLLRLRDNNIKIVLDKEKGNNYGYSRNR